jgi:hypothetical protein
MDGIHDQSLRNGSTMKIRVWASLALLSGSACDSASVSLEAVPGVYRMEKGRTNDVLVLCADSTWVHRYSASGEAPVLSRGPWELESTSYGDVHVILQGYPILWRQELPAQDPRRARPPKPGDYSSMLIEPSRSGLRLIVDVDANRGYVQDTSAGARAEEAETCAGRQDGAVLRP